MTAEGSDSDLLLEQHLDEVRKLMAGCLAETPLHSALAECKNLFGTGKMLRSRLALRVGPAAGAASGASTSDRRICRNSSRDQP